MATDIDVKTLYENALIDLVIDFPIYAQLISRIGVKIIDSPNGALAFTDGTAIYINKAKIEEFNLNPKVVGDSGETYNRHIGKQELMFILCHELLHLIGLTFERGTNVGIMKGATDKKAIHRWRLWNKATDYEINSLLNNNEQDDGCGHREKAPVGNMLDVALYESKYMNMNAEEIFQKLLEEEPEPPQNDPSYDDGDATGNGKDGLEGIDDHEPILDETTKNEVISKMSEVFGSRSNGTGSSALDRVIEKVYKPEPFNWRRALTKYIRGWMKDNYTWNKPSRAGIANGLILPSAGKTPRMHIGVAVDTSGSIYDTELQTMMNHLFTILTQFKDFTVDVWCCGSQVYPETLRTFTASNKNELHAFEFKSDGGNDMRMNFEFIKNNFKVDKLDVLIIMSDFYDPLDGDTETTSPCPVIYMCLDHDSFKKPSLIKGEVYPFTVEKEKNY